MDNYEENFKKRLYELRNLKGVSARDMSLSLGQSESYINKIENGKNLPSMQVFFYICEYLNVNPSDFFDFNVPNPELINKILKQLSKYDNQILENIYFLLSNLHPSNTQKSYYEKS